MNKGAISGRTTQRHSLADRREPDATPIQVETEPIAIDISPPAPNGADGYQGFRSDVPHGIDFGPRSGRDSAAGAIGLDSTTESLPNTATEEWP